MASPTKKRTPGLPPKELFFGAFPYDKRLCVVECLKEYEQRIQKFRETTQEKPLFLSYVRPHKLVTSQRLAHWVKDLLRNAGVDRAFKAHSVWGASTSAAMARGVSLADILHTADLSRESTFRRFYFRESYSTAYVSKALQSENTGPNHT